MVASLAIAAVLLALLMHWGGVGPADFARALGRLDGRTWAFALGLHLCIYALRAWRFALLVPRAERPAFGPVMAVSAAHNLASYVLPAKTGEATLVVYLKAHCGVSGAAGLASLVVSRLFDLAVLCAGVSAATLVLGWGSEGALGRLVPLALVLLGLAAVLAFLCLRPHLLSVGTGWALRRLRLGRLAIGRAILARLGRVGAALEATGRGTTPAAVLAASVGIWLLVFAFYAVLARGVGLPEWVGYPEAVFGSSLAVLFNLRPVNGFAGFGTQEAGWKIGFVLLGVEGDLALATGLAVHLVQLANVVLLGLIGHLVMGLSGGRRAVGR